MISDGELITTLQKKCEALQVVVVVLAAKAGVDTPTLIEMLKDAERHSASTTRDGQ